MPVLVAPGCPLSRAWRENVTHLFSSGSLEESEPLIVDLLKSTIRSAAADPRFQWVSADEAAALGISISILSHQRAIPATSEQELVDSLRPDHDGLIIRDAGRDDLFRPQVWEALPDPRALVRQLKTKAGLAADHWSPTFQAWRFTTESF